VSKTKFRKSVQDYNKDAMFTAMTLTKWLVLLLLVFAVVGSVAFVVRMVSKPAQVIEKVADANRMIYTYEWFKQTKEDWAAATVKLKNAREAYEELKQDLEIMPRSDWSPDDTNELSRLRTIAMGLENHRAQIAADYNARASMVTRNFLMGKDGDTELPMTLDE